MHNRKCERKVSSCCLTCCYLLFIVVRAGVDTMCQSLGARAGARHWRLTEAAWLGQGRPALDHNIVATGPRTGHPLSPAGLSGDHTGDMYRCDAPGGPWPGAPPPGSWHEPVSEAEASAGLILISGGGSCLSPESPCVVCCYLLWVSQCRLSCRGTPAVVSSLRDNLWQGVSDIIRWTSFRQQQLGWVPCQPDDATAAISVNYCF